ncbi:MAG: hypothetical protein K2J20_04240, partial [Bacilli bacterium]|nr:hypothetical protein [Bacilli bacterium]
YKGLIDKLTNKTKNEKSYLTEEYILLLASQIIAIEANDEYPKVTNHQTEKYFDALKNGNYELALTLSEKYDNRINEGYKPLKLLLIDIIERIAKKDVIADIYPKLALMKENKYEELLGILEEYEKNGLLDAELKYLLILIRELLNIRSSGKVPFIKEHNSLSMFEAIDNKDFAHALCFAAKNDKSEENNWFYIVLFDINYEIEKAKTPVLVEAVAVVVPEKKPIVNITSADIINLIKDGKFAKLRDGLDNKKNASALNFREEYVLKVVESYFKIKETGNIPEVLCTNASSTAKAIDGNNFSLALDLFKSLERKGADNSNNSLYLMLEAIVALIQEIEREKEPSVVIQTPANEVQEKIIPERVS